VKVHVGYRNITMPVTKVDVLGFGCEVPLCL
jgi:hypothetical protein